MIKLDDQKVGEMEGCNGWKTNSWLE